ncbi:RICIN domain-containing protein [Planomonospora sp. ID67723]|uniref:RICIN domain-containing protein n=1 Tax=Planomonospora sp. ID67723 TaxID=2738134 RepID=UPI0018C43364|nr:RICIN domain-containing protein [Planomonospora sp. ID67723]MBG0831829.1 RICIN domain-containing protein [Planomonospora sp. ID67723]
MPLASALPTGSVMMVHHVTGTYFMCNDFHDNVGNHVQTWAQDPFADATSHRWTLGRNPDGTVVIRSAAHGRALTVGATPAEVVTLREGNDSLHQNWRFEHVDTSADSYVIASVVHPSYALSIASHLQANDQLLGLTRMWGGPNLSQVWKVFSQGA